MSQPFYFSSCPSSSLHYSSARPPRLFPSLPPSFTLALCEGHAIDFPLSIHFSVLVLKRGKQTKAIPPPTSAHSLPSPASRRSYPPSASTLRGAGPGLTFLHCSLRDRRDRTGPAHSRKHHSLNICVLSTDHPQFILTCR